MPEKCYFKTATLDLRFVKVILEKLHDATKSTDLFVMISKASVVKDNEVRESLFCLKKLIQLNASGYIDPPINFGEMLNEILAERQSKEVKDDT